MKGGISSVAEGVLLLLNTLVQAASLISLFLHFGSTGGPGDAMASLVNVSGHFLGVNG